MKDFLRIMLLAMMVCCWSCSGGGEDVPTPTPTPKPEEKPKIEVTTTAPVLAQEGETATVTFTSSDSWTIDVTEGRAVSWCSVTPTSGSKGTNTLTIKTTANDTYDERNAKVTIKSGTTTQSFVVTQKQKDGLTVTSNKVEVGAAGGDVTIEVKANVKYEYEIEETAQSWIAGGSRALTASTIKLKVAENENTSKREGKITIRSGELSETVTVYQEGSKPTIVLTQNEYTVASEGETIKVELKSNVNYDIQLPSVDWIKESSSRAMSVATHYFEVASNEGYDARSAEILFVNKDNGLSEKVTINQMQKDAIIVAKNEYTVDAAGGDLKFEVNTNVDFKVATSVDWIKQNTESRGLEAKPLSFKIAENTADKAREGVITISSGDLKQEIKVIQKAKTSFSVSETEFNVGSDGGEISFTITTNAGYAVSGYTNWLERISKDNHTFVLKVHPNEGYDARYAEILVFNKDTEEKIYVKVTQAQKDAIVVAKNEYTVEAPGGTLDFEVNTNVDFKVETSVDWIKQNTESRGLEAKPLSFKIAENTADTSREGVITITSGDLKQEIKVIQNSKAVTPYIKIEQKIYEAVATNTSVLIKVNANIEFETVFSVDWITNSWSAGNQYCFLIQANVSKGEREGTITFKNDKYGISEVVTIKQKELIPYFEIDKKSFELNHEQHFIDVNIKSNLTFDIEISADWVYKSAGTQRGEEYTFQYGVSSNYTQKSRTATITYKNEDFNIEEVVVVEQNTSYSGKIEFNQNTFELKQDKQTVELIVKSNLFLTYEISEKWLNLKQIETKEEENTFVYVFDCEVDANNSNKDRTATITFKDKDSSVSKVVTIKQERNKVFEIEKETYVVSSKEQIITVKIISDGSVDAVITDDWIQQKSTKYESIGDNWAFIGEYIVKKNSSENERNAVITFNSSLGMSKQIKIKQKGEGDGEITVEGPGGINDMKEHIW